MSREAQVPLGFLLARQLEAPARPGLFLTQPRGLFGGSLCASLGHSSATTPAFRRWRCGTLPTGGQRRLLRARRERPHRRAAEQGDELAPFHVWMAPAWQEIIWRAAQRSLAVMCPACWCSPGGLLA